MNHSFTHQITLADEGDAVGIGGATVEVGICFWVDAGDPGYYRDANGDGCPPTPDEVVLVKWWIVNVSGQLGPINWCSDSAITKRVSEWVAGQIGDRWEEIEGWLLAVAEDER